MPTDDIDWSKPIAAQVPWEWSEAVCSCENPVYGRVFPAPTDNTICIKCNKLARWQLLVCRECNQYYIFTFRHHARTVGISMGKNHMVHDKSLDGWALDKRLCWNCICDEDPAVEGDKPPLYTKPPREARSIEDLNNDLASISFDFS